VSKAYDWLDRADVDLDLAEIALQQKIPRLEGASYSIQQAAEKTIKAILQHVGVKIPKTHDITELVDAIPAGHHLLKQASALEPTTPWSVQSRYPSFETVPPAIPDRQTCNK
jgi:HEPN domain-containing protein